MTTGINESGTLTQHISYECECKFDCRKCNWNEQCNNDKSQCECKTKKKIVCSNSENSKYLASIIDNLVITCDETMEETKAISTFFNKKVQPVIQKNYIFCLPFRWLPSIIDRC